MEPYPPSGFRPIDGPDARVGNSDGESIRRGAGVASAGCTATGSLRGGFAFVPTGGGVELEVAVDDVPVSQYVVLGQRMARLAGRVGRQPAPNGQGAGRRPIDGRAIVVVVRVGGVVDLDEEPAGQMAWVMLCQRVCPSNPNVRGARKYPKDGIRLARCSQ